MVNKSIIGATCACLAVVSLNVNSCLIGMISLARSKYMPKSIGLLLLSLLSINSYASTVSINSNTEFTAIGSLDIAGDLYDISFDGAFGESMFLGNQLVAEMASQSISDFLNSYGGNHIIPTSFPRVANTYTWKYHIAFSTEFSYSGSSGAGWTCCRLTTLDSNALATFRLAIPGSIPNHVPLTPLIPIPPAIWLFGSGLIGLIGVARRKA